MHSHNTITIYLDKKEYKMFHFFGRSKRMRDALVTLYSTEYRREYETLKRNRMISEYEMIKIIEDRLRNEEITNKH